MASCSRAVRAGTAALKGWACESVVAVDVVTADGELVHARRGRRTPTCYWAARGAGPGFPGVVTRFHLQTYAKPAAMWQDTWTFQLDDAEAVVHWLHEVLPTLDRRVEPVMAATRLPDVPLYDGVEHPGGTVLLLHTTVHGRLRRGGAAAARPGARRRARCSVASSAT